MRKFYSKFRKKIAAPPGTLLHIGDKKSEQVEISVLSYGESGFEEIVIDDISKLKKLERKDRTDWINIYGLHDTSVIEGAGNLFGIDMLTQEDILNTMQRPKIEEYEDHMVVILKMLTYDKERSEVMSEQISVILGKNYLISFQEQPGDVFDPVRKRIKSGRKKINQGNTDYLLYTLIDSVVDNYFLVMEQIADEIEQMEDRILNNPGQGMLQEIQRLRKEIIYLRKAVWPLREILSSILRGGNKLIKESTYIFFRDIYDHTIQVIETSETFRDLVAGLQELYLSTVSNSMNQVMKVLTIIATIFIPLTFIAGIYGMNFEFMPELKWKAGYFIIWGIMILVGIGMGIYFKRKKWF